MLTSQGFTDQATSANAVAPDHIQLVPHSAEAEQALLGALVIDPAQMLEVGYLVRSDFYLTSNGHLYQAMADLFQRHQGYDQITLTEHLETAGHLADIGGIEAILDMINMTPTSLGAPEYAAIIYQHSISRQVIDRAMKATQAAYKPVAGRSGDMLVNEVIGSFGEIDATRNVSGGPQSLKNGANALMERRETIQANGRLPGVMTGIKTLDAILDGIEKNRLYLLAGRPGMGKSALILQMAYNMARSGKRILLFSLEMEEIEITARLASIHCALNGRKIAYKDISAGRGDDNVIVPAIDYVSRLITVDTTPALTVAQIRNRAQKVMMSERTDLIIVDHGGLATPAKRTGNSYNDANQIAADMQALPKQLGLPVLCLVQLSRDFKNRGKDDKRPQLTDLRDTGKWEENADCVMFVHRDQYHNPDTEYPNLGEIIVAKNRAGASAGSATVYVDVATNRFVDLETRTVAI